MEMELPSKQIQWDTAFIPPITGSALEDAKTWLRRFYPEADPENRAYLTEGPFNSERIWEQVNPQDDPDADDTLYKLVYDERMDKK